MRPTEDLAYRARNWFWYWRVRHISSLSNDQLDLKCFGDQGRKRHFERLQSSASSPDEVALVAGSTLLDLVDGWERPVDGRPGPYASLKRDFKSRLWEFLAGRDLAPSVYCDHIQEAADARGWMRAGDRDYSLYETFLGDAEPAIESGISTAYSAMLHKLVNEATPDATAVLLALFREAMHRVELEQAIAIRTALNASIAWMGHRHGIPERVTQLLRQLVRDRVLANRWVTEADWRKDTNTPVKRAMGSRARIREFQAWVTWYTRRPRAFDATGYGRFPLVPQSARTDWLETHRGFLEEVGREFHVLREQHINFRGSLIPEYRDIAEDARIRAEGLLSHFNPPEAEPTRFYDNSRPALEMGHLPTPFLGRPTAIDPVDS
jgi:hypothetical protein